MTIINGKKKETAALMISYETVVDLANTGRKGLHTVTYRHRPSRTEGSLLPGQRIRLQEGMIFGAVVTGGA